MCLYSGAKLVALAKKGSMGSWITLRRESVDSLYHGTLFPGKSVITTTGFLLAASSMLICRNSGISPKTMYTTGNSPGGGSWVDCSCRLGEPRKDAPADVFVLWINIDSMAATNSQLLCSMMQVVVGIVLLINDGKDYSVRYRARSASKSTSPRYPAQISWLVDWIYEIAVRFEGFTLCSRYCILCSTVQSYGCVVGTPRRMNVTQAALSPY
jgi:hypothetical protein